MTRYGVTEDYDYNDTHKRHRLILWSGPFRDVCEGSALSVRGGYMVTPYYGEKFRVTCPSPRDGSNFREVDAALDRALRAAEAAALDRTAEAWRRQADRLAREALDPLNSRDRDADLIADSWAESRRRRERAAEIRAELDAEEVAP